MLSSPIKQKKYKGQYNEQSNFTKNLQSKTIKSRRVSEAKLSCGVAKGKKKIDKRELIKQRDWNIKKQRLLKNN